MSGRNLLAGLPAGVKARRRPRMNAFRDKDGCLSRNGIGSAASLFAVVAI
jgi:hypothetical protein